MLRLIALLLMMVCPAALAARPVQALRVTVLSAMLSDQEISEWGYAALVEVDGKRISILTCGCDSRDRTGKAVERYRGSRQNGGIAEHQDAFF